MFEFSEWKERSVKLVQPNTDICFVLNGDHPFEGKVETSPNEISKRLSSISASKQLDKLISYFRKNISANCRSGGGFTEIETLFWLSLKIHNSDRSLEYSFSWYDHLDEIIRFQEWVSAKKPEEVYDDMDQCWGIAGVHEDEKVYLLEYNSDFAMDFPDSQENQTNGYIEHQYLNTQLLQAVARVSLIVSQLSAAVGEDVWTKYRGYPWDKVQFGTDEWRP